jgi:hypothetical protein
MITHTISVNPLSLRYALGNLMLKFVLFNDFQIQLVAGIQNMV